MSPPTATPRTDAALYPMNGVEIVWPDFARQLETELAASKAECERLKFAAEGHLLKTIQQQAELARLRAELAVAENWVEHHSKHADDLIAENVKLRADLERFTGDGLLDCHAICDQRDAAIARAERAEAALAEAVDGKINGGSIFDKQLVIHIPRSLVGYRVGQLVKVILPAIDAAMKP